MDQVYHLAGHLSSLSVKTFSGGFVSWAFAGAYVASRAAKCLRTVSVTVGALRAGERRSAASWWTPFGAILTAVGAVVKRKSPELAENRSRTPGGPCPAPLGPPAGGRRPAKHPDSGPEMRVNGPERVKKTVFMPPGGSGGPFSGDLGFPGPKTTPVTRGNLPRTRPGRAADLGAAARSEATAGGPRGRGDEGTPERRRPRGPPPAAGAQNAEPTRARRDFARMWPPERGRWLPEPPATLSQHSERGADPQVGPEMRAGVA